MISFRRSGAYTLLEVVVVAVISSILLYLGMRWVYSISTASLEASGAEQGSQLTYALDNLEDDIRASTTCDPYGMEPSLRSLSPNTIVLVSSQGADGAEVPTQVMWRLTPGGDLQRGQLACGSTLDGSGQGEDPQWRTMAAAVTGSATLGSTSEAVVFEPVVGGVTNSSGEAYDDCADGCAAGAVKVSLARTDGTASTARVMELP